MIFVAPIPDHIGNKTSFPAALKHLIVVVAMWSGIAAMNFDFKVPTDLSLFTTTRFENMVEMNSNNPLPSTVAEKCCL